MDLDTGKWFGRLGRFGLAARGFVYILIGWLALQVAMGHTEQEADRQGVLRSIASKPFGNVLLIAIGLGFLGYAAWRLADAAFGKKEEGKKAWVVGGVKAGKGALYAWFALNCFLLALQKPSGGNSNQQAHKSSAHLLQIPGGKWLVMLVGAGLIAVGLSNGIRGVTGKFFKDLKEQQMGEHVKTFVRIVGTAGLLARMVAFGLIGLFFLRSGISYDPGQAIGIDGALKKLLAQSHGDVLLSVLAIGLAAFGILSVIQSKYRSVDTKAA